MEKEKQLKERISKIWERYEKYKDTAEQADFPILFLFDTCVVPEHDDLLENFSVEHAEIFIKNMEYIFKMLGIKDKSIVRYEKV